MSNNTIIDDVARLVIAVIVVASFAYAVIFRDINAVTVAAFGPLTGGVVGFYLTKNAVQTGANGVSKARADMRSTIADVSNSISNAATTVSTDGVPPALAVPPPIITKDKG